VTYTQGGTVPYKEFWIYPSTNITSKEESINVVRYETMPELLTENTVGIRAIEYAAFDEAQKEIAAKDVEILMLKDSNFNWQTAHTQLKHDLEAQSAKAEKLFEALKDANDLCRSAFSVSSRAGRDTNFWALTGRLKESLERQHKALQSYRGETKTEGEG
jgi:hypothetical protein